jgi:hypothetical protein
MMEGNNSYEFTRGGVVSREKSVGVGSGSAMAEGTGYNRGLPAGELAEWLKAAVC